MKMMSSRLMMVLGAGGLVAGGVLTAAPALAGASGSVVAEPRLTAAGDVVRQSSSAVQLSTAGGAQATVVSETLPAGSWVLSGNATLVGWGPSDYTRCILYAGGTVVGGATTMVGNPGSGSAGTGVFAATVSTQGAFSSTSPTTVSMRCAHDADRAAGAAPYVDPQATLWAHRTDGLGQAKR
ncbi:hypothetical protein GO001_32975 [Streptomyces sp. NRRL B-1677]|uniref:hypothetical protein n=1 Tax=Streptomyces TaxID=1883 RepID=UPI001892BD73|nr:hypothetical protein [Streptomyces sp. NRRL B-1677]MBF6049943.1 hypothetical protein [Streptomyces sp. NRRL B-1677]